MNALDERRVVLAERAEDWRKEGLIGVKAEKAAEAALATGWKNNRFLVRLVFFFLASLVLGAFYGFWNVVDFPLPGLMTAAVGIALAEYLIGAHRWFWTGVEEALWLGGGIAAISELPRTGTPESMLVLGAVFAAAGARLRNPLFGTIAAICVMVWAEQRFDAGALVAMAIATAAMFALLREWARPSTEWLLFVLAVGMPIAALFVIDDEWVTFSRILFGIVGVVALTLGRHRPHHAFFLAALIGLGFLAQEAIDALPFVDEGKIAIGGALLLAIAFAVSRALRDRTRGLVLTPSRITPFDESVQIVATLATAPEHHDAPPPAGPSAGGGQFGGAGASGDY